MIEKQPTPAEAPPEELKAFKAGMRVGYQQGWQDGYVCATMSLSAIQPSEVLWNKPKNDA